MNVEHPSPLMSSRRCVTNPSINESVSSTTAISVDELVAAVESGELDLDDSTLKDSWPCFRFCISENHKPSKCQQGRTTRCLIWHETETLYVGETDKRARTSSLENKNNYRQCHLNGWQNRNPSPPGNWSGPHQLVPAKTILTTTARTGARAHPFRSKPVRISKEDGPDGGRPAT